MSLKPDEEIFVFFHSTSSWQQISCMSRWMNRQVVWVLLFDGLILVSISFHADEFDIFDCLHAQLWRCAAHPGNGFVFALRRDTWKRTCSESAIRDPYQVACAVEYNMILLNFRCLCWLCLTSLELHTQGSFSFACELRVRPGSYFAGACLTELWQQAGGELKQQNHWTWSPLSAASNLAAKKQSKSKTLRLRVENKSKLMSIQICN